VAVDWDLSLNPSLSLWDLAKQAMLVISLTQTQAKSSQSHHQKAEVNSTLVPNFKSKLATFSRALMIQMLLETSSTGKRQRPKLKLISLTMMTF
jgi:hypothetical protein